MRRKLNLSTRRLPLRDRLLLYSHVDEADAARGWALCGNCENFRRQPQFDWFNKTKKNLVPCKGVSMKLSEVDVTNASKILLYGNSGSGKTCFAAGFPLPILYLDFDNKVDSAAAFYKNDKTRLEGIDVRALSPSLGINPMVQLQEIITNELIPQERAGAMQYKTLVLDSITTFSAAALNYIVQSNPGIKRNVSAQGQQPGLQDYGILKREFQRLIPGLLGLPLNVVMLGHISTEKDDLTGELVRGPLMDGSFAKELSIYFKSVWRSYVDDKGVHWAQTKSDAKYACRSQIPGLINPLPLSYSELEKFLK